MGRFLLGLLGLIIFGVGLWHSLIWLERRFRAWRLARRQTVCIHVDDGLCSRCRLEKDRPQDAPSPTNAPHPPPKWRP